VRNQTVANFIAEHVREIPRSGIRDFFEIVQSMTGVISLGIGEPDYVTPWRIREAAIFALEKGKTGYTSNFGLPRLRQAISRYLERHIGVRYDPKTEILVSVGVSEALDLALRATINPGDEVLFHEPSYVSYNPSVALAYGKPVAVRTSAEAGFKLLAEDLEAKISAHTKALILSFPTNPTGACLPWGIFGQSLRSVSSTIFLSCRMKFIPSFPMTGLNTSRLPHCPGCVIGWCCLTAAPRLSP